eukprot:Nk52_evm86s217 gene=Nk52_evmTU86s217
MEIVEMNVGKDPVMLSNDKDWRCWLDFQADVKALVGQVSELELERDEALCRLHQANEEVSCLKKDKQLLNLEIDQQRERDSSEINILKKKLARSRNTLEEEKKKLELERRHKEELSNEMKPILERAFREKKELEDLKDCFSKEKQEYVIFKRDLAKVLGGVQERIAGLQNQFVKTQNVWKKFRNVLVISDCNVTKTMEEGHVLLKEIENMKCKEEVTQSMLKKSQRLLAEKDSQIDAQLKETSYLFDSLRSSKQKQLQLEKALEASKMECCKLEETLILQQTILSDMVPKDGVVVGQDDSCSVFSQSPQGNS